MSTNSRDKSGRRGVQPWARRTRLPLTRARGALALALALGGGCATPKPPPRAEAPAPAAERPRGPATWAEVLERHGSTCPGPFFKLPKPTRVEAGGRSFLLRGSTLELEGGRWSGALKIGVLGAIKDADDDTRQNIKKAAREFSRLGVHLVVANGDLVGEETGDLDEVVQMLGREFTIPVLVHSGNYEWTTAFTEAVATTAEAAPHVFNMNLIRDVDLGGVHLLSLPGWSNRKFVKPAACWYTAQHVDELRAHARRLVEQGDVVILTAHGPPRGRGKQSIDFANEAGNVGDEALTELLIDVPVNFGIFSHILEAGGRATDDARLQKPLALPMRRSSSRLYVNAGSASSFGWPMLNGSTSRGMAAVVVVDELEDGGRARVSFLKLR